MQWEGEQRGCFVSPGPWLCLLQQGGSPSALPLVDSVYTPPPPPPLPTPRPSASATMLAAANWDVVKALGWKGGGAGAKRVLSQGGLAGSPPSHVPLCHPMPMFAVATKGWCQKFGAGGVRGGMGKCNGVPGKHAEQCCLGPCMLCWRACGAQTSTGDLERAVFTRNARV